MHKPLSWRSVDLWIFSSCEREREKKERKGRKGGRKKEERRIYGALRAQYWPPAAAMSSSVSDGNIKGELHAHRGGYVSRIYKKAVDGDQLQPWLSPQVAQA